MENIYPQYHTSVVTGAPKAFYQVPAGTTISVDPTSAGTATVFVSTSSYDLCLYDVTNNLVTATTKAGATISSATRSGNVCTVTTSTAHGLVEGMSVTVSGANETPYNGTFNVRVKSTVKFEYTALTVPSGTATGSVVYVVNPTSKWVAWGSGAVTEETTEVTQGDIMAVAIVPASGTWSMTRIVDAENLLGKSVYSQVMTGITSGKPKAVYQIPPTASFTVFPTSAGTATLYYSTSEEGKCKDDVLNNRVATGLATWAAWVHSDVTILTQDTLKITSTSVALKVASGTWTMEACTHG
jgi:hypothetical protein